MSKRKRTEATSLFESSKKRRKLDLDREVEPNTGRIIKRFNILTSVVKVLNETKKSLSIEEIIEEIKKRVESFEFEVSSKLNFVNVSVSVSSGVRNKHISSRSNSSKKVFFIGEENVEYEEKRMKRRKKKLPTPPPPPPPPEIPKDESVNSNQSKLVETESSPSQNCEVIIPPPPLIRSSSQAKETLDEEDEVSDDDEDEDDDNNENNDNSDSDDENILMSNKSAIWDVLYLTKSAMTVEEIKKKIDSKVEKGMFRLTNENSNALTLLELKNYCVEKLVAQRKRLNQRKYEYYLINENTIPPPPTVPVVRKLMKLPVKKKKPKKKPPRKPKKKKKSGKKMRKKLPPRTLISFNPLDISSSEKKSSLTTFQQPLEVYQNHQVVRVLNDRFSTEVIKFRGTSQNNNNNNNNNNEGRRTNILRRVDEDLSGHPIQFLRKMREKFILQIEEIIVVRGGVGDVKSVIVCKFFEDYCSLKEFLGRMRDVGERSHHLFKSRLKGVMKEIAGECLSLLEKGIQVQCLEEDIFVRNYNQKDEQILSKECEGSIMPNDSKLCISNDNFLFSNLNNGDNQQYIELNRKFFNRLLLELTGKKEVFNREYEILQNLFLDVIKCICRL